MPTLVEIELDIINHEGTGSKRVFVFFDDQNVVEFSLLTTIEGVQYAQEHNYMTSATKLVPGDTAPDNGESYEPTVFDADKFGRNVTGETDGTTDFYTVTDPNSTQVFSLDFPTGTTLVDVYARINSLGQDPSAVTPPTALEILEQKAVEYRAFGSSVFDSVSIKIWAINVLAKNDGHPLSVNDLIALLTTSDTLEKALKSGSLDTATYILGQLVIAFPQYADVGNAAIAQINDYQGKT